MAKNLFEILPVDFYKPLTLNMDFFLVIFYQKMSTKVSDNSQDGFFSFRMVLT